MKLKLISVKKEAKDINSFIFESEMPISWKAGQYLIVSLNHNNSDLRGKMRFFTIASSPFEKNPTITTKIFKEKPSTFKNALGNLKIGDFLEAKGPDGDLTVEDKKRKYIFITGGMGITPFRSIISELNHKNLPINIHLVYINRNKDFLFKKEFDDIKDNHPEFKIDYFLSPFKVDKNYLLSLKPEFEKTFFYISGPETMIENIKKILEKLGTPRENIKEDYFLGYSKI